MENKNRLFKIYEFFYRKDIQSKIEFFDNLDYENKKTIEDYQYSKLKTVIESAYNNIKFYKNYYDSHKFNPSEFNEIEDIKKIPFIDKNIIKDNLNNLINPEFRKKDLIQYSTGGSTGEPMKFYWDKQQKELNIAIAYKNYLMTGWNLLDKTILFTASPIDINSLNNFQRRFKNNLKREYIFTLTGLNDEKLFDLYKKIRKIKPTTIIGFTSSLILFSKWLADKKIKDLSIPIIIQSAEKIEDFQIKIIEENLNGKYYKHYGSREAIGLGIECKHRKGMHANIGTTFIEILRDNKNTGLNEPGEIVITNLHGFGMPLIRYKIGDVGIKTNNSCECGRNSFKYEITEGRIQDIITTTKNKYISSAFFPHLFKEVADCVKKYQVHQVSRREINLCIVKSEKYNKEIEYYLRDKINKISDNEFDLKFIYCDKIENEKSGKYRAVKSDVEVSFGNK